MVGTVAVHGSGGKVMAPLGSASYLIEGKRRIIRVISVDDDEDIPSLVREALRGMNVVTIFTADELPDSLPVPPGSIAAYAAELADALRSEGKDDAADLLLEVSEGELGLYIFEPDTFEMEEG